MFKTSCKKCVFNTSVNGIQTGCKLGRLEKFKAQGVAELTGDFYTIDRFCNTCRDESSFISIEALKNEIKVSCCFIVDAINQDPWRILKNISNLKEVPIKTIVVLNSGFDREKYLDFQNIFNAMGKNLIFKRYVDKNVNFFDCVDEICSKLDTQYYSCIFNEIEDNIIEHLNKIINEDLERVLAIIKENNSIISVLLHKKLNGNKKKCIIEKLKELKNEVSEEEAKTIWLM